MAVKVVGNLITLKEFVEALQDRGQETSAANSFLRFCLGKYVGPKNALDVVEGRGHD